MFDFQSLNLAFLTDATFWTAAAAIIALLLGAVGPFFHDWVSRNWKRPKLSILFEEVASVSEMFYEERGHRISWPIRALVTNKRGRKPAHEVEVFLEGIEGDRSDSNTRIPTYLPIRIPWAHSRVSDSALEASTCSRIVGGGKQLLDLGTLEFRLTSMDGALIEETCLTPHLLNIHIAANVGIDLPSIGSGEFKLRFLIASEGSSNRVSTTVSIKKRKLEPDAKFSDYIEFS